MRENTTPGVCFVCAEAETAAKKAKEIEAERLETEGPREGDLSAMLNGVVDVVVLDAPRTMYEPRRGFPWGPRPTTDLTVAGIGERGPPHTVVPLGFPVEINTTLCLLLTCAHIGRYSLKTFRRLLVSYVFKLSQTARAGREDRRREHCSVIRKIFSCYHLQETAT